MQEIPGCKIRFLRFDGKEEHTGQKWNAVKDEIIEGTVPRLVLQTAKILDAQLCEFSRLGKDGTFISAKEYPSDAWYETMASQARIAFSTPPVGATLAVRRNRAKFPHWLARSPKSHYTPPMFIIGTGTATPPHRYSQMDMLGGA